MAFTKRTWIARDVQYPGRKILTPTGNTNEYDVTRSEGTVSAEGDILSAENLNDMEQRILTAILATANGTNGDANNALKLGGLAASLYPHTDVIDSQNALTLLNGWTASWGSLDIRRFGRVVMIGFDGAFNGAANTIIANLPDGWNPSGSWIQLGGNLAIIEGNAIRVVNASISSQSFVIVA